MEKFREYNGLSGLRASNLMVKNTKKIIPNNGRLGDFFKTCDEVICDLLSDDIWLFVEYILSSSEDNRRAGLELKVAKECSMKYLLLVLEKLAMNFWSYINSSNPKYYYLLKNITCKAVRIPEAKSGNIPEDSPGEIIDDSLSDEKVGNHFSFESALLVKVDISTLEAELIANPKYSLQKFNEYKSGALESPTNIEPADLKESVLFHDYSDFNKYIELSSILRIISRCICN